MTPTAATTNPTSSANTDTSNKNNNLPKLTLLGTTALATPAAGGHLACNPAIDLTATAGDAGAALCVWRAGDGRLVSKVGEKGAARVEGLRWKGDGRFCFLCSLFGLSTLSREAADSVGLGQFVAAGWSDGVVRLVGVEGGKAVHAIRVPGGRIGFVGWGRNVTGESKRQKGVRRRIAGEERRVVLDGERTGDVAVDLPRELTFLEVETALPKLSPLPVSGGSG